MEAKDKETLDGICNKLNCEIETLDLREPHLSLCEYQEKAEKINGFYLKEAYNLGAKELAEKSKNKMDEEYKEMMFAGSTKNGCKEIIDNALNELVK